jgi:hypothetical protein
MPTRRAAEPAGTGHLIIHFAPSGSGRTACAARALLFSSAAALAAGCRTEAVGGAVHLDRIPGISALEYDGLDVIVSKARSGAEAEWTLLVPGGAAAQQVFLRVGDQFLVTDGRTFSRLYELLRPGEDGILFRRETRENRQGRKEGYRIQSTLVSVLPYGAE